MTPTLDEMVTLDEQIAWAEAAVQNAVANDWLIRHAILATLREAKAAQAQQPVAWMRPSEEFYDSAFRDHRTIVACTGGDWTGWIPLYAAPVAPPGWVLNRSAVNEPQAESINALIARCKHAHYTNVVVRINGKDEWHEADWIKHMTAAPKEPK